jgi:methionyl-tRNA formyltransferase
VTRVGGEALKVWRARIAAGRGSPGTLLETGTSLLVACGEQALAIDEVQRPGGRRMAAREFLHGHALEAGMRLA